jgi:hypothetical protein
VKARGIFTNVQLRFVLKVLDWRQSRAHWVDALERTTGRSLASWNQRIGTLDFKDEKNLRAWLDQEGVTGYPQMLLVMEQFGYPDYLRASASRLIRTQYADRQHLRPVYDAIIEAVLAFGDVTVQARKTYVSLVGPRRTFARVQPTTRRRVDLMLRIDAPHPEGRLKPSRVHDDMPVQISLSTPSDVDAEVTNWLKLAYRENARPARNARRLRR